MKRNFIQRGFSLISAIFLLVVLAGLGAAMVSFSTAQNQSQAMDVLGSRAYQAANAGIEWAAYNIALNPGVAGNATFVPGTGTALGGDLQPFAVTVGYVLTPGSPYSDETVAGSGVQNLWSYDITATAVYGTPGSANYVERVVTAKIVQ